LFDLLETFRIREARESGRYAFPGGDDLEAPVCWIFWIWYVLNLSKLSVHSDGKNRWGEQTGTRPLTGYEGKYLRVHADTKHRMCAPHELGFLGVMIAHRYISMYNIKARNIAFLPKQKSSGPRTRAI